MMIKSPTHRSGGLLREIDVRVPFLSVAVMLGLGGVCGADRAERGIPSVRPNTNDPR